MVKVGEDYLGLKSTIQSGKNIQAKRDVAPLSQSNVLLHFGEEIYYNYCYLMEY